MAIDPSRFASLDQRNELRARVLENYIGSRQSDGGANRNVAELLNYAEQQNGSMPLEQYLQAGELGAYADAAEADYGRRDSELRRKVAAFEMAGRPSQEQEQSALVAAARAPIGWLNTVLDVVDTPRRWTFEHLVDPAARALGLVAPDEKLDPTGYDLWIKALGGAGAQEWLSHHIQQTGLDQLAEAVPGVAGVLGGKEGVSPSQAAAQKLSGAAGLGLDILLDPLSYLTFGAGSGIKAGGRALTRRGIQRFEGMLAAGVKVPEADEAMRALRAAGTEPDLFKRGGAHFKLPMNAAELHVPGLNREEQWGLFLGGYDASKALSPLNGLHRTLVDLGGAALARIPIVPDAAEAAGQGIRNLFVPLSELQGAGRALLTEALKGQQNIRRSEGEVAHAQVERLMKRLTTENQKERTRYWLDIGAAKLTPRGTVQTIDFDDYALEQLMRDPTFQQRSTEEMGKALTEGVYGLEERLKSQRRELGQVQQTLQSAGSSHEVAVEDLAGLRPDPSATSMSGMNFVQKMIDRVDDAIASRKLGARHDTAALVTEMQNAVNARRAGMALPPTTLEALEPDEAVRGTLAALLAEETAHTPAGPVRALMDLSLRFGQQSFLQNYLSHIRVTQAPGVGKIRSRAAQLGVRKPAELGQQRTLTFLAEPEELKTLGYLTDPQAILSKKLAQYRAMARESEFVKNWVLPNFGRKLRQTDAIDSTVEDVFDPHEWFSKSLPTPDELGEELKYYKEHELLDPLEADTVLNLQRPRAGEKWALPRDVMAGLQETRHAVDSAGGFFAALDGAMSILRAGATLPAPSYHVRNVMGNLWNSALGGVSPLDYKTQLQAQDFLRGKMDGETLRLVQGAMPNAGVAATDVLGQAGPGVLADPQQAADWLRRTLIERGVIAGSHASVDLSARLEGKNAVERAIQATADNPLFKFGRTAAQTTDNTFRIKHLLSRMKQGDTLEEAIISTKKYLFDFNDLAPFEKRVLRPAVFFYSWTRKNLPLMLETLLTEPRAYSWTNANFRAMSDRGVQDRAEAALMPAFIREQLGITLGLDGRGRVQVLTGLGLPIEDINTFSANSPDQFLRKLVGFTNPVLQAAAVGAGMPVPFTGERLLDDAESNFYRNAGPLVGQIRKIAPGFADFLGIEERKIPTSDGREITRYTGNPVALYALSQLSGLGRLKSMADQAIQTAQEEPTGEGVAKALLRTGAGVRTSSVDLQRQLESLETTGRTKAVDAEHDATLDTIARRLRAGEIDPAAWREQRSTAKERRRNKRDELLQQQLAESGVPLGETDRATVQAFRDTFAPKGQKLLDFVFDLDPGDVNPLDPDGGPFRNAAEFAAVRDELMDRLKAEFPDVKEKLDAMRERTLTRLSPEAREVEELYAIAIDALDKYNETPKYIGLDEDETRTVDRVLRARSARSRSVGTNVAKAQVREMDPEGSALADRARRNDRERRLRWQELNQASKGLLGAFFGNVPLAEAEALAQLVGPAAATPGFDQFG